ncbi:35373_t:CDS:2, partial [Racocetra persica]
DNHKVALCKDILYRAHIQLQDLDDASDIPNVIEHEALTQLENILLLRDRTYLIIADTKNRITLLSDIVVTGGKLSDLINYVYPNFIQNSNNINYLTERAILTPKNNDIN